MSSANIAPYESFLVKNVAAISSLESTLRSLTWFLPGRFKDAELASEALSSLVNVIGMYHDTLLSRITKEPSVKAIIPLSLHHRYTKAWTEKSVRYKWMSRVLELIRYTELVLEMGLKRKSTEKTRWRAVVLLETLKAFLRLSLLHITRRPLMSPPLPEREFDPSMLPPSDHSTSTIERKAPSPTPDHLRNNRVPLAPHSLVHGASPLKNDMTAEEYLLPKALTTSSVRSPTSLVGPLLVAEDWAAEILYIARPLIYAILYARDRKSSRPLVTILILEVISRKLRRNPPPSAALERSEYAHRDKDILWYLLRGSVWQAFTRPKLSSLALVTSRAPLLGVVGAIIEDWIPLIDEYYYYTAP